MASTPVAVPFFLGLEREECGAFRKVIMYMRTRGRRRNENGNNVQCSFLAKGQKRTHLRESNLQLELKESFWNTCPSCGWGSRREMKAGVGQRGHMESISVRLLG